MGFETADDRVATILAPTWAHHRGAVAPELEWRVVDTALRRIAQRRAALDAEEARWLREAEALQIWRPLGMVNALDYMERVLGYAPRAAQDRLRVARALGQLPELTAALACGALPFSAVRELTRVATPATEAAWAGAGAGKNLRQIEALVAGHRPGDLPDDPADPEVRAHLVRFELSPETFAALRQARAILDDEHGSNLDDDAFVATLAGVVLDGPSSPARGGGSSHGSDGSGDSDASTASSDGDRVSDAAAPSGRARFQIAVTLCERCKQGWQHGAGAKIPIGPEAVVRAECDAQHLGSLEAEVPARAYQDISPAMARLVWQRDGGRCQTPGCRSSRGLEIHHVVPRAQGGGHEPGNLRIHCSACHRAQHAGTLAITGTRDRLEIERAAVSSNHPRPPAPAVQHFGERAINTVVLRTQAKDALVGLGWKPGIARDAVTAALAALGPTAALDAVIREALRRCPRPA